MAIKQSEIKLNVDGRPVQAYLAEPQNGGPGVLVLHAWWGLKPIFKEFCDRLAGQGFIALAPDLRNGQIAESIEAAKELMEKSDNQFAAGIVTAAKNHLLALSKTKAIGAVGFSMGAAWALEIAEQAAEQFGAIVLFYGVGGVDFSKVRARILGHFAATDEWEPIEGVRTVEKDMKAAGLDVTFHIYPGVSHWFVEEDRPEYNPAAASLAWERTVEFLKKNL
jgi:carboxymethylenebutenolidase